MCFAEAEDVTRWFSHRGGWQLRPVGFVVWMSCMFTLCECLAGQKTIFPQYIWSLLIFPSVCHCLSFCPSHLFPLFLFSLCPQSSLSCWAAPPPTSADAYRAPSMCVCRTWAFACQKRCILFIQSQHGPGCWMPFDSFAHTHARTHTNTDIRLNWKSSILWCLWGAAGCHNEQSTQRN